MPSVQILPGPELDEAVAKACGIEGCIERMEWPNGTLSFPLFCISDGNMADDRYWSPSTNIAAAFDAAEKYGLFREKKLALACENEWEIISHEPSGEYGGFIEGFTTPALAICAAIIELSELTNGGN